MLRGVASEGWLPDHPDYVASLDKAAAASLTQLIGVDSWQSMEPTLAAHAVQINAEPNSSSPFCATATVQGRVSTGAAGACAVYGDAVLLAQLVDAADQDWIIGSTPDHIKEIRWIAQ